MDRPECHWGPAPAPIRILRTRPPITQESRPRPTVIPVAGGVDIVGGIDGASSDAPTPFLPAEARTGGLHPR